MDKNLKIEKRMEELKKIYSKLEEILDKLPDSLPESVDCPIWRTAYQLSVEKRKAGMDLLQS